MSNIINSRDIDNYIENLFDLLSKQDYCPLGVELTREERKNFLLFFIVTICMDLKRKIFIIIMVLERL